MQSDNFEGLGDYEFDIPIIDLTYDESEVTTIQKV